MPVPLENIFINLNTQTRMKVEQGGLRRGSRVETAADKKYSGGER